MARRCILIGIDGANPRFVLRTIGEGKRPSFKRVMDECAVLYQALDRGP